MTEIKGKKLSLTVSSELIKAAKARADQEGKTLTDWVGALIEQAILQSDSPPLEALDWGRIDSRIDQRTASLERQLDALTLKVERLVNKVPQPDDRSLATFD